MNEDLMKKAQEMQKNLQEAQKKLENIVVTGSAAGGDVKIDMDGLKNAKRITINPDFVKNHDNIVLEEAIKAAINDATQKAEVAARDAMSSAMMGGGQ